jgi:hypothetical protein
MIMMITMNTRTTMITINETVTMIPFHQHPHWPFYVECGRESSANVLVPKNMGLDLDETDTVQIPKQHAVYMFECKDGALVTWYPTSRLVSVNNERLYSIFDEYNNLFGSYAWLAASKTTAAEYLTVKDTPMRSKLSDGVLTLTGKHIHRRTGLPVAVGFGSVASTSCIEMRQPIPPYSKGFKRMLETVYRRPAADHMRLINTVVVRIQRWWKQKLERKGSQRTALWTLMRDLGCFALLCDDLFSAVIDHTLRVSRPRQLQCEFPPIHPPEARR